MSSLLRNLGASPGLPTKADTSALATDTSHVAPISDEQQQLIPLTTPGVARIREERHRQIEQEGYAAEHDDAHRDASLTLAAICYAGCAVEQVRRQNTPPVSPNWPWHQGYWNPNDDPVRNLEKAGALIAAEIDRILRAREAASPPPPATTERTDP